MRDFYIYGRCVYGNKQGIGRKLFEAVIQNSTRDAITVNSSPYAIEVYKHLGFSVMQEEQITDGIRYTSMLFTK